MHWIEQSIQAWQAIIDHCHRTPGSCLHYLERAYRTRDGFKRLRDMR